MDVQKLKPAIKDGWLRVLIFIIPFMIVAGVFQFIAIWIIHYFSGKNFWDLIREASSDLKFYDFLVIQSFVLLGTLFMVSIFVRLIDKRPFFSLGFDTKGRLSELGLGIFTGALVMVIGVLILSSMGLYEISEIGFIFSTFISSLILCILISLSEEIVMRGYVLNNLMASFPNYMALMVSALLFALLHAFNPNLSLLGMFNLFLAGLLLGVSYIYTKNLWFPIGLHFSWNFFQGPVFGFNVSGLQMDAVIVQNSVSEQLWSGGSFGFEGSVLASILSLITMAFIGYYFRQKYRKRM